MKKILSALLALTLVMSATFAEVISVSAANETLLTGLPSEGLSKTDGGVTFSAACNNATAENNNGTITFKSEIGSADPWMRAIMNYPAGADFNKKLVYEFVVKCNTIPEKIGLYAHAADGDPRWVLNQTLNYSYESDENHIWRSGYGSDYIVAGNKYTLRFEYNGSTGAWQLYKDNIPMTSPQGSGSIDRNEGIGEVFVEFNGINSLNDIQAFEIVDVKAWTDDGIVNLKDATLFDGIPENSTSSSQNGVNFNVEVNGSATATASNSIIECTAGEGDANSIRVITDFPASSATHTGYLYYEYTLRLPSSPKAISFYGHSADGSIRWDLRRKLNYEYSSGEHHILRTTGSTIDPNKDYVFGFLFNTETGVWEIYENNALTNLTGNVNANTGISNFMLQYEAVTPSDKLIVKNIKLLSFAEKPVIKVMKEQKTLLSGLPSEGISKTGDGIDFSIAIPSSTDAPGTYATNSNGIINIVANRTVGSSSLAANNWARIRLNGDTNSYNYTYYEWKLRLNGKAINTLTLYGGPVSGSYYTSLNQPLGYFDEEGNLRTGGVIDTEKDYTFGVLVDRVTGKYGVYQDYVLSMSGMYPEADGLKTLSNTDIGQMCLEYSASDSSGLTLKDARVVASDFAIDVASLKPAVIANGVIFSGLPGKGLLTKTQNDVVFSVIPNDCEVVNDGNTITATANSDMSSCIFRINYPITSGTIVHKMTVNISSTPEKIDQSCRPANNEGWSDVGFASFKKPADMVDLPLNKDVVFEFVYDADTYVGAFKLDGKTRYTGKDGSDTGIGEVYLFEPFALAAGDTWTVKDVSTEYYTSAGIDYASVVANSYYERDTENNKIYEVDADGNKVYRATAAISSKAEASAMSENVMVVIAAYNSADKLISCGIAKEKAVAGDMIIAEATIEDFETLSDVKYYKAFLWDSDNCVPLDNLFRKQTSVPEE